MNEINWKTTEEEDGLIDKIVARACKTKGLVIFDRMSLCMDITACHLNGTPLDLRKLLNADEFNFIHDIGGIRYSINRSTGKLVGHFLPRCAAKDSPVTYRVRVRWLQRPDLSAIVDVADVASASEAENVALGMSGEFYFEQGGHGTMGHPTDAEVVE